MEHGVYSSGIVLDMPVRIDPGHRNEFFNMDSNGRITRPGDNHLAILRAAKPHDPNTNLSTPLAEACQWAAREIDRLRLL